LNSAGVIWCCAGGKRPEILLRFRLGVQEQVGQKGRIWKTPRRRARKGAHKTNKWGVWCLFYGKAGGATTTYCL